MASSRFFTVCKKPLDSAPSFYAVIEGQAEVHHRSYRYSIAAHHGSLLNGLGRHDGCLGMIDDGLGHN